MILLKRTIITIICFCVCLSFSISANAFDTIVMSDSITYTTTPYERDQAFNLAMESILPENEINGPRYQYKHEMLEYEYRTITGFAGNQVAGGYRFPTGGGFWFTDTGGPEVNASFMLNLPSPYNFVSVSINLGQKGTSGSFVTVPNTTDYFKLYVEKVIELRPYITYRRLNSSEEWQVYNAGAVPVVYSVTAYARKV